MRGLPRHRAIHRAGVDVAVAEPLRDRARQRALACARRPVDRNHEISSQEVQRVTIRTRALVTRAARIAAIVLAAARSRRAASSPLPYLDALGFIIRAADCRARRRRSRRGAPIGLHARSGDHRADARAATCRRASTVRRGTTAPHAGADARRASRRHRRSRAWSASPKISRPPDTAC